MKKNISGRIDASSFLAWGFLTVVYVLAYAQRVSPQTISGFVGAEFNIPAPEMIAIASAYFVGYTVLQFPAGVFVDVYGVRKVVLVSMMFSVIGTVIFAAAPNLGMASVGRLLTACGDAMIFTSLIKLIASNFPSQKFATLAGISQAMGYFGGVMATAPLSYVVSVSGWRYTFFAAAILLMALTLILSLYLERTSINGTVIEKLKRTLPMAKKFLQSRSTWGGALTFGTHFAVVTSISGVWGTPLLTKSYGMTHAEAGEYMMVYALATMLGAVGFGFLCDRISSLYRTLIWVTIVRIGLLFVLCPSIGRHFPKFILTLDLIALGIVAGGMVPIILKCIRRMYSPEHIGLGGSINTTVAGFLMVIMQPILGMLLHFGDSQKTLESPAVWEMAGYDYLLVMLMLTSAIGIFAIRMMRDEIEGNDVFESRARPRTTSLADES